MMWSGARRRASARPCVRGCAALCARWLMTYSLKRTYGGAGCSAPRKSGVSSLRICQGAKTTTCKSSNCSRSNSGSARLWIDARRKEKMKKLTLVALALVVLTTLSWPGKSGAQANRVVTPRPLRPVHTFSIVARDPRTGELGVAVQSHWFSVGATVPWAEAGVGAVATQSFVDPSYGRLGLELMRTGKSASDALRSLLAGDDGRDVRQVAMIDAQGRVEAHTGAKCIVAAGHYV